ncbi:hypothetical protein SXYLSMQ121_1479 [Staphylococcus xylosus]|nr:hypothetical protein SXYLSMQ121_1479 [Staphylococcus xylosus]
MIEVIIFFKTKEVRAFIIYFAVCLTLFILYLIPFSHAIFG